MASSQGGRYVFMISFVAAAGGFLFGYDLGVIVGANDILKDQFQLSSMEFGFATSSAPLGCIFGPFLGWFLADRIGRKRTMLIACLLLGVSALFTAIPETITQFYIFRFIGGIGVGLCSLASPMYIAEVAPRERRGGLGIMYQLAIVIGHVIAPLIGAVLAANLADEVSWRWMFASEGVAILGFTCLILLIPNSPRWLASKGRHEDALQVLTRVGGAEYAQEELKVIEDSLSEKQGSIRELFAPGLRFALMVGFLLAIFNNWTGWSVMGGYIVTLLQRSGIDARWVSFLETSFVYAMMGSMALLSLLIVDKVGRKPLWNWASVLMALITILTGAVFHFEWTGLIVLVVIGLCTIPHGIALGPLPWLMMSELFPTRLRAKAVAMTTTLLWVVIWIGSLLFPWICYVSESSIVAADGAAVETASVSFVDRNLDSIVDPNADFLSLGLATDAKITISGSAKAANNGEFSVYRVLKNEIVLADGHELSKEAAGAQINLAWGAEKSHTSNAVAFVDANLDTIVDSNAQFASQGFKAGRKVTVSGAQAGSNNATYHVKSVSPDTLLVTASQLANEEAGATIRLQNGSLGGAFWLFTIVCVLSLLFGKFMLPETKGRTLEEIAASWKK